MNKLIILTLFLSISVSLSKPSQHDGGFSVDIFHRDSPLSPLYNTALSQIDRIQNAFHRSTSRAFRLLKMTKSPGSASKMDADIFSNPSGDYIMKIQIGTPPVQVYGSVTMSSDFIWVPCEPCKTCYKQASLPLFVPANSSTYQTQLCRSNACKSLADRTLPCDTQNICHYTSFYQSGTVIKGVIATDTFWFGPTPVEHVLFGCVNEYKGGEKLGGVFALGGDTTSLANQLKSVTRRKFSYCLPPYIHDASNLTTKIHFGDSVNVSGPNVVSTSLVKKDFEYSKTFYYVNMIDVLVGNKSSSFINQSSSFSNNLDHVEYGNMIIDLEGSLTYLPMDMYNRFAANMKEAIGGETVEDPRGNSGFVCYKDLKLERVPTVTLRFDGGYVKLPRGNLFSEVGKGVSCLDVYAYDDGVGFFGNLFQRNVMVSIDLDNQKVHFKPTDCTMHGVLA